MILTSFANFLGKSNSDCLTVYHRRTFDRHVVAVNPVNVFLLGIKINILYSFFI